MPDQIPPKKITPSEESVKPAPTPPTTEEKPEVTEGTKEAAFAEKLNQKEEYVPKSSFHAAFGKMLGSEATAAQIDRFVNTWVQDQLREMRKQEQKLHKTWRQMR